MLPPPVLVVGTQYQLQESDMQQHPDIRSSGHMLGSRRPAAVEPVELVAAVDVAAEVLLVEAEQARGVGVQYSR